MGAIGEGRCAVAAATALAVAVFAAGCGAAGGTVHGSVAAASFRNDFLAFRHPMAWRPASYSTAETLHFHPIIYLSSQPTHDPCRQHASETACGWPVSSLRPGGVLIVWENRGFPGWSLASEPGTPRRIGGRPGKENVSRPGECAAIGADETIELAIKRPVPYNWTAFTACLRTPTAATEQQINALLASTRFLAP
jgi:hypothetical protein